MLHVSTRGYDAPTRFIDAMLLGLAPDGGLFLPQSWPRLSPETIRSFSGKPYQEVAHCVLKTLMASEIDDDVLKTMIDEAYASFRHKTICPLSQVDHSVFLLELFHGPTLAFKDVAMQLLGRLMDHALKQRRQQATIVGATSGDTGSAAIEAFKGLDQTDIFILYPHGRVSEVQRRQMTTVNAPNVHAIALDGSFDDCQNILKALFNDQVFRDRVKLSGVNSINWARVAAQTVYYFTAAVALGAPSRSVAFSVPTGNFGDILAGWVAKQMGLPVEQLIIATNENDILKRVYETGKYALRDVVATSSPSMDIQISSNFERLLFEVYNRDAKAVKALMSELAAKQSFTLAAEPLQKIRHDFSAVAASEAIVEQEIRQNYRANGILLDPHTAVGLYAAHEWNQKTPHIPVVSLATAHCAKFPDAVEKATGIRPELPDHLKNIMQAQERITRLPNNKEQVVSFILGQARAAH